MPATLRVDEVAPRVRALTLSHPERKGALTADLLGSLAAALDDALAAGSRALLIRGEGGTFSAGYDLSGRLEAAEQSGALPDALLGEVLGKLQALAVPSVALLEGGAWGAGCELACACDFRVGDGSALFCMPPAKLGVVYSLDGLARVARLCGLQRARRMFLTAARVDAEQALAWGLLDARAPVDRAAEEALALCSTLAGMAPLAVAGMKQALGVLEAPVASAAQREALVALRRQAFASEDAAEGVAAFLEKRAAAFTGR